MSLLDLSSSRQRLDRIECEREIARGCIRGSNGVPRSPLVIARSRQCRDHETQRKNIVRSETENRCQIERGSVGGCQQGVLQQCKFALEETPSEAAVACESTQALDDRPGGFGLTPEHPGPQRNELDSDLSRILRRELHNLVVRLVGMDRFETLHKKGANTGFSYQIRPD